MDEWEIIYNRTPCYFFSFSNNGMITRINDTLLADLEYERAEIVNTLKLEQLLTVGSRIFFQTHFYPLIKMQGKANEIYLSFQSKNAKELPVLLNVVMQHSGDDYEIHCGGMQITQRNRFEKELLEAKKVAEKALLENDELIRLKQQLEHHQQLLEKQLRKVDRINNEHYQIDKVLSHDLQEPLRKISMFTSMVLEKLDPDFPQIEKIQRIGSSANKIRNLIDSMQKFHSLDYRKFSYAPIELRSIIEAASRRAGNDVSITFDNQPYPVFPADDVLLADLFQELLANSCRFISPEKQCAVRIDVDVVTRNIFSELENKYRYEDFIRINYSDNGLGFENEYADQTFNLFKKLHPNSGLGIGLAYCKKIVDLHLGSITVKSEPGIGSTFTILLPSNQPAAEEVTL